MDTGEMNGPSPDDARPGNTGRANSIGRWTVLGLTAVTEGGLATAALLIGPLVNVQPLTSFRWDAGSAALGTVVAVTAFVLVVFGAQGDYRLLRETVKSVELVVERVFAQCTVRDLLVVSVLAGVGEELFFRGLVQRALTPGLGWVLALLVQSALFGAAHLISLPYFWYASAFGLAAGGLLLITDNLLAPIAAHAIYDFLALVFLVRRIRRKPHGPQGHFPRGPLA